MDDAKLNTLIIRITNIFMIVINVALISLFTHFLFNSDTTQQMIINGGVIMFNAMLVVIHIMGMLYAKVLSGETKKALQNEEPKIKVID